jgi:hypothetical protein
VAAQFFKVLFGDFLSPDKKLPARRRRVEALLLVSSSVAAQICKVFFGDFLSRQKVTRSPQASGNS